MRSHAVVGHPCCKRSPDVVKVPFCKALRISRVKPCFPRIFLPALNDGLVQHHLRLREPRYRALPAGGAENKMASIPREIAEQFHRGVRKVNLVRPPRFCVLARQSPELRIQINMLPSELRYFAAALAGQHEKAEVRAERIVQIWRCGPNGNCLVRRQDSLARRFFRWWPDFRSWRGADITALDAPAEPAFENGQGPV